MIDDPVEMLSGMDCPRDKGRQRSFIAAQESFIDPSLLRTYFNATPLDRDRYR